MPRPNVRNFPASMLPPPPMAGAMAAPQRQAMQQANLEAAMTEAPWVNQMQQPPMMAGGVPGAQGMNEAAAMHAAALAANAPGGTPVAAPANMPPNPMIALDAGAAGAPPVAPPRMPGFTDPRKQQMGPKQQMLRNMMLGGGIGSATNSGIGVGVGAGLGGLATYLASRKKSPVGATRNAKGGVIEASPGKPPVKKPAPKPKPGNRPPAIKMAAGGAAKERKGFPNTIPPPRMKGNPIMRGMGKATRGHSFKGVY